MTRREEIRGRSGIYEYLYGDMSYLLRLLDHADSLLKIFVGAYPHAYYDHNQHDFNAELMDETENFLEESLPGDDVEIAEMRLEQARQERDQAWARNTAVRGVIESIGRHHHECCHSSNYRWDRDCPEETCAQVRMWLEGVKK